MYVLVVVNYFNLCVHQAYNMAVTVVTVAVVAGAVTVTVVEAATATTTVSDSIDIEFYSNKIYRLLPEHCTCVL